MMRLKVLGAKHAALLKARGIPTTCAGCGKDLKGEVCWHRRASGRSQNRVNLFCANHLYPEPRKIHKPLHNWGELPAIAEGYG